MAKTETLNPKKRYTARSLKQGQLLEIDGINYVVLIIGAMWGKGTFTRRGEQLLPAHNRAIIAPYDDPGTNLNLVLHNHDAEEAQDDRDVMEQWSKFDLSEEQRERILNTPINVTEYGDRTYLQNLLFSVHSHPPEGLGIIYSEVDLERVCDHMINYLESKKVHDISPETLAFFNGKIEAFEEMKAFFSHKS